MDKQQYKCILISNFNVQNFAGYMNNDTDFPAVDAIPAPYGQVAPVLVQKDLECWQNNPDFAVIWTQPENITESFNKMIRYENVLLKDILNEVDEYSSLLMNICTRVNSVFVPMWTFPSFHRVFGMLDMKTETGLTNTLMRMNLRLSENLEKAPGIYLLNSQKWVEIAGKNAFAPNLWYMGKIPFGNEVFTEAVKDIKSALRGISGNSRKLVILDLDDTLWGGIVGDAGWENLTLGGHNHIGEAYADFQHALKSLTNRGILLGIASKNDEAVALEAINSHPEMVLKQDDFVGWRINWQDKAQNIADLVSDLNLGLQSVVFIDDNPAERARVRDALPEVLVPEWPEDKMMYKSTLLSLRCFDLPSVSTEDLARTKMYVSESRRKDLKKQVGSLDEWLHSLNIKVKIEELNDSNLQRTTQLLNKTNQMNLSTRRMAETELADWANQEQNRLWIFRVSDKFGDSGLTGIISVEINGERAQIVDFILSCRVMGRKIEETMLFTAIQYARSAGLNEVIAKHVPTAKNKPCLEFFQNVVPKFKQNGNQFTCNPNALFPKPAHIETIK